VVSGTGLRRAVDAEFEVTARELSPWPDPHPDRSPADDEYSRLTDPARWRLVGARADAWMAAFERLHLARAVDVHELGWEIAPRTTISRTTQVRPSALGALPLVVCRSRLGGVDDAGVTLGVGEPAICVAWFPECGCDACELVVRSSGSSPTRPAGASCPVVRGSTTADGTVAFEGARLMTSRLVSLCFDANDPLRLARFWAAALQWEVDDETADEVGLVPTDGTRFQVLFLPVPEQKVGKNRIHLDLTSTSLDDQQDLVDTLIELGARHIDVGQGPDDEHVVLADPEGNELCIIEPGNRFLAGCGRFGSITCDGTPEVGYFWSAALGWPLVWDQNEETAIRAPDGTGPFITWGPPLAPKTGKNRLHLDIAPPRGEDQESEVERLVSLGATRIDIGQGDVGWVVMADPDRNEFCVLTPR
jgi:hypothetical protein